MHRRAQVTSFSSSTDQIFRCHSIIIPFIHRQYYFVFFYVILFLYFLPIIAKGENTYITIHDNLDSEVTWRVVLANNENGTTDSGVEIVPQIMDGIPRSYMISDLNIIMILFRIFKPFTAYLINHLIVHIIAFLGMYLLTSHYLVTEKNMEENYRFISLGVSAAFGLLPFYTMYGLSVAGIPLLLFSYLNIIHNKEKILDYLVLIVFPFYSFLTLDGVHIIGGLIIIFMYFLLIKKRFSNKALFWLCIYITLSIITEYKLIRSILFDPNFISHRSDWNLYYVSGPVNEVIYRFGLMFLRGAYHASSHHELILLITIPTMVIIGIKEGWKKNLLLGLLIVQIIIAFIYGLYYWEKLIPIKNTLGIISSFQWGRIFWLSPSIWYIIFFISLMAISRYIKIESKWNRILIIFFITCQFGINLANDPEYGHYINRIVAFPGFEDENITYRQFYSEDLFRKIKDSIGLPQEEYRVVSIGIHPSIAQYNGFYTLDSYQNNYPLAYKQSFRKIIAPELDKSRDYQEYFDYWGSRCYIFSSEIPDNLTTKDKNRIINNLDLDTQAFLDMGGRYIFSAAEIMNYRNENMIFLGAFEDKDSVWKIFVYEVIRSNEEKMNTGQYQKILVY